MNSGDRRRSILIFDSGLGGLSALPQLRSAFPDDDVHYLADDAFFPLGDKSPESLRARLLDLLPRYVRRLEPRFVALACNTGFLAAGEALRAALPVPVFGCTPPVGAARAASQTGLASVIATPATVALLREQWGGDADDLVLVASQDLAPAVEDYFRGDRSARARILRETERCFVERAGRRVDVVTLGCTHYALVIDVMREAAPWPTIFIESNVDLPLEVKSLSENNAANARSPRSARGTVFLQLTSESAPSPAWEAAFNFIGETAKVRERWINQPLVF